tara:strand:+ start:571 stop:846 length:276 start_codon:yes stop_codon:yes gene_type:complete
MNTPFYQKHSASNPIKQKKKSQLQRQEALVSEAQANVDKARASFGTKNVDEGFDRHLRVLKKRVAKAKKLGSNMNYDTRDASGAGETRKDR